MNFIQGLLNPQKNNNQTKNKNNQQLNTKEKKDDDDYNRLLELCNSYGLDQKQTAQLIEQFKKGNYNSMDNSYLNQSQISADDSLIESRNKYHQSLNQYNQNDRDHKHQQQYQGQDQQCQDRHYQYKRSNLQEYSDRNQQNRSQKHHNQKFQINENNTSYNQMTFNDRSEDSQMYPHLKLNSQQNQQDQLGLENEQSFNYNFRVKQACGMKKQIKNSNVCKNANATNATVEDKLKGRQKQSKKNSRVKDKQMEKQQIKMLIKRKSMQLRSIQQFQQQEEEYHKEQQNYMLQKIEQLSKQIKQYQIKCAQYNQQNEHLKKENQFLLQKLKESEDKVNIFIKMKESDTAIVLGLKDTITSLTNLLQQKQLFCQDLQNKLNQAFVQSFNKNQKVNVNIPSSTGVYFQRSSFDKQKVLHRKSSSKNLQNQNDSSHTINQNKRKQLSDLTNVSLNNVNKQQNGKLIRQNSMKKLNTLKDKQSVKRTSSRIDIKKYKGMIEQLRSNYGH